MNSLIKRHDKYNRLLRRAKPMDSDNTRTEYQRDIHRIIYSDAFRRLRHKTQVFFRPNNDHICTRLEHVLHVAEASWTVARQLKLREDLTRAIALGHDIGHPPFGHWGEKVLSEIAAEHNINDCKFEHEVNGLRVVDRLARLDREPEPGLNLTYAVRDGIISHCGEDPGTFLEPDDPDTKQLESIRRKADAGNPVTYEGCIVRILDKVVYAGRDLEDALKAGIISEGMVTEELSDVTRILGSNNGEIVGTLVENLIQNGHEDRIALSDDHSSALKKLIEWNYAKIYTSQEVERYQEHTKRGIKHLFDQFSDDLRQTERFAENNAKLPATRVYAVFKEFIGFVKYEPGVPDGQVVLDFIAGMTDNYLINCISEIFVPKAVA